jgi:hypothetical protein
VHRHPIDHQRGGVHRLHVADERADDAHLRRAGGAVDDRAALHLDHRAQVQIAARAARAAVVFDARSALVEVDAGHDDRPEAGDRPGRERAGAAAAHAAPAAMGEPRQQQHAEPALEAHAARETI